MPVLGKSWTLNALIRMWSYALSFWCVLCQLMYQEQLGFFWEMSFVSHYLLNCICCKHLYSKRKFPIPSLLLNHLQPRNGGLQNSLPDKRQCRTSCGSHPIEASASISPMAGRAWTCSQLLAWGVVNEIRSNPSTLISRNNEHPFWSFFKFRVRMEFPHGRDH